MNVNDLLLKVNHVLEESGVIDDVTDFFHEHPEYFTTCTDGCSIISNLSLSIAMCCRPQDRQNASVFITSDIGAHDSAMVALNDHSRTSNLNPEIKYFINKDEVSRYVYN